MTHPPTHLEGLRYNCIGDLCTGVITDASAVISTLERERGERELVDL